MNSSTPTLNASASAPPAVLREVIGTLRGILAAGTDRTIVQRDAILAFSVRIASAGILYLSQIVMAD